MEYEKPDHHRQQSKPQIHTHTHTEKKKRKKRKYLRQSMQTIDLAKNNIRDFNKVNVLFYLISAKIFSIEI